MMQQTSIFAYRALDEKKLNKRQQLVLDALLEVAPATNRMIADYLNWPINTVTPRCLELRGKGKVVAAYIGIDQGRKATYWRPLKREKEYENE